MGLKNCAVNDLITCRYYSKFHWLQVSLNLFDFIRIYLGLWFEHVRFASSLFVSAYFFLVVGYLGACFHHLFDKQIILTSHFSAGQQDIQYKILCDWSTVPVRQDRVKKSFTCILFLLANIHLTQLEIQVSTLKNKLEMFYRRFSCYQNGFVYVHSFWYY